MHGYDIDVMAGLITVIVDLNIVPRYDGILVFDLNVVVGIMAVTVS